MFFSKIMKNVLNVCYIYDSYQVFLTLPAHLSLPPPHFYRPTPNHPHSYVLYAQTTSIYPASPPQPRSVHQEDCTNPHCVSYPSATLRTSISPSSALSSPDYYIDYGMERYQDNIPPDIIPDNIHGQYPTTIPKDNNLQDSIPQIIPLGQG